LGTWRNNGNNIVNHVCTIQGFIGFIYTAISYPLWSLGLANSGSVMTRNWTLIIMRIPVCRNISELTPIERKGEQDLSGVSGVTTKYIVCKLWTSLQTQSSICTLDWDCWYLEKQNDFLLLYNPWLALVAMIRKTNKGLSCHTVGLAIFQ